MRKAVAATATGLFVIGIILVIALYAIPDDGDGGSFVEDQDSPWSESRGVVAADCRLQVDASGEEKGFGFQSLSGGGMRVRVLFFRMPLRFH